MKPIRGYRSALSIHNGGDRHRVHVPVIAAASTGECRLQRDRRYLIESHRPVQKDGQLMIASVVPALTLVYVRLHLAAAVRKLKNDIQVVVPAAEVVVARAERECERRNLPRAWARGVRHRVDIETRIAACEAVRAKGSNGNVDAAGPKTTGLKLRQVPVIFRLR